MRGKSKGAVMRRWKMAAMTALVIAMLGGCTQETQNRLGRAVQNWTGTNGVLDLYAGDKLVMRFIKIDKLTTAHGTQDNLPRNYRFGYGYLDKNFNYKKDPGERKLYFEVSNFSNYIFYENPEG
jgi:hypothetical protein